jgi:hypothetical protein
LARLDASDNRNELFDHLVGAAKQGEGKGETERPGGLEIDDQLHFCGLLDWQVGRLSALEDAADIDGGFVVVAAFAASAEIWLAAITVAWR